MSIIYHTNQTLQKFDTAFKEFNVLFIVGPTGGGKTFLIDFYTRKYQYTLLRVEVKGIHRRLPLTEIEESTQKEFLSNVSESLSSLNELETEISEKPKNKISKYKNDSNSSINNKFDQKPTKKEHINRKTSKRLKFFKSSEELITSPQESPSLDNISTDFDDIPLHLNQSHTFNPVDIFETDDYSELRTFLAERTQSSFKTNKLIIETRNPNLKKLVLSHFSFAVNLSVPQMTKIRMKKFGISDANLHTLKFHKTFLKRFCLKERGEINRDSEDEESIYGVAIVAFNRHLARLFNGRPSFKNVHFSNFSKIFEYIFENYVNAVFSSRYEVPDENVSFDEAQDMCQSGDSLNTCRNIIEMLSKSAYYESVIHKVDKNLGSYFSDTYGLSISYFHSIMSKRKGNRKYVSPNDYFKPFSRK